MNHDGRLIFGAIFFILGAGSLFLVKDHENWSTGTKYFFVTVALVFVVVGLALAFAWLMKVNYKERAAFLRVKTDTEAVKIAQAIEHMSTEQIDALSQFVPAMEIISGVMNGDPNHKVGWKRTPAGIVDLAFMQEFADLCSDEYIAPIRSWPEESKRGVWARRIRDTLIYYGWIEKEAFGNKSYRFIDRDRAMNFLKGM